MSQITFSPANINKPTPQWIQETVNWIGFLSTIWALASIQFGATEHLSFRITQILLFANMVLQKFCDYFGYTEPIEQLKQSSTITKNV